MSFVVDTDTCSAYLKGHGGVFNRFRQHGGGICISILTLGELYTWAHRLTATVERRVEAIGFMLSDVRVLPLDELTAFRFGSVRGALLNQGLVVPVIDLFIAATALQHDFTIVTNNE